jgi:bifunctional DNase/RNase
MLVEMKVAGLAIDPVTNMPILILRDLEERQAIPIWIGLVEAGAIATELEQIELARPMTHDLVKNLLDELGAEVIHVEILDLRDNTYFANLVLKQGGRVIEMDARPSDAIAIALRVGCSIYVHPQVIEKAGVLDLRVEQSSAPSSEEAKEILASLPESYFGKWKM